MENVQGVLWELCVHTSLKMYRCRFIYIYIYRFLNQSSPPSYEILYRRVPAGWTTYADQADDELALSLWSFLLSSSHTICYYSCPVCLQTLLCGCLAQFLAPLCRPPRLKATSQRLRDILEKKREKPQNNTGKYLLLPREESTT